MEAKIPSSHVMFRCGYLDPLHLFGRREWGRFFFFFRDYAITNVGESSAQEGNRCLCNDD